MGTHQVEEYYVDHILSALNPMFKGISAEQRDNEIIFSWGIHHVSISKEMLENDRLGDIDIAKCIGKDLVELAVII